MRRLQCALLATVATIGFASIASAADMPVKARMMTPVYNWAGCYIGGHAGAGWAKSDWTNTANTTAFGDMVPGNSLGQTNSGFVGGGQLGCNYQVNQWVFGIEGTFSGTSITGDLTDPTFGSQDDVFTTKINSIATVTGRIGYAINNWLPYIKGGYAGADVKFSVSDTLGPNQGSGSQTNWHNGWTLGGGLEYGLTPNWIVGIEYDYMRLNTKSYNVAGASAGVYTFDVTPRISQLLGRISYKF
jgi:outer membrane immunogenic protein